MSALRRAFRLEKRPSVRKHRSVKKLWRRAIVDPARPESQTLISAWNLLGCHGISSVKKGLGRNRFGSSPLSNGS
jgi:hypothetical protein